MIHSVISWNLEFRKDGIYVLEGKRDSATFRGTDKYGKRSWNPSKQREFTSKNKTVIGKIDTIVKYKQLKRKVVQGKFYGNIEVQIKGKNYILMFSEYIRGTGSGYYSEICTRLFTEF